MHKYTHNLPPFFSLPDHNLRGSNFPFHVTLFTFPAGSIIHLLIHSINLMSLRLCQALCSPSASSNMRPDGEQAPCRGPEPQHGDALIQVSSQESPEPGGAKQHGCGHGY